MGGMACPHHRMKTSLLSWRDPPGHCLTHPLPQYVGTGGGGWRGGGERERVSERKRVREKEIFK